MSNEDNDRLRRLKKSEEETQGEYKPAPLDPTSKTTDKYYRPALDKDNMPLPRRVDEIDVEGTRVTRAAYEPTSRQVPWTSETVQFENMFSRFKIPPINWRSNTGCFLRGLIVMVFAIVVFGLCAGSYFVYQYYSIASTLPDVGGSE